MTTDPRIERLAHGGPRQRQDAYDELYNAIVWDGARLADRLPTPETVDEAVRPLVIRLRRAQRLVDRQWGPLARAWQEATDEEKAEALYQYGNVPNRYDRALFEQALEVARSDDPALATAAAYALERWLVAGASPAEETAAALLAGLQDKRPAGSFRTTIGAQCRNALMRAASTAAADALRPVFAARTRAKAASDRKLGAEFLARMAIHREDAPLLAELAFAADTTVRKAASDAVGTNDPVRAKARLAWALRLPLALRGVVADAIAAAFEPKLVEYPAVAEVRGRLFDPSPEVRRDAVGRVSGLLSLDLVDVRTCAPHAALSLFDEVEEVRERAATTVYYVCDMQAGVPLVNVTEPLIRQALPAFRGTAASELQSALKAFERR